MMETNLQHQERILLDRYGPTLDLSQLSEVLHQAVGTIRNRISKSDFPIPTFRSNRKRLALVCDVATHLVELRDSNYHLPQFVGDTGE